MVDWLPLVATDSDTPARAFRAGALGAILITRLCSRGG